MTNHPPANISLNVPKIAGFFYAIIIVLSMIPPMIPDVHYIFNADNAILAMDEYESYYRISTAIEFIMFMSVMVLSWALYVLTKPVHKPLATLAFTFRFGEAVLGCVVILFYLLVLVLLDSSADYLSAFSAEQLKSLARFFLKASGSLYYVLLTIMGIGGVIYCYLFYLSSLIPKALSVWGIVTYTTMIVYGMVNIGIPNVPQELAYAMLPGALFEFLTGLWLFFKGVNVAAK